jgi:hypothetical protein
MAKPGLNGSVYRDLRLYMKIHFPWICHRCGEAISRAITAANPRHRRAWSADHSPIPRAMGGPTALVNLKPAHNECNSNAGNEQKRKDINPQSRDWGI